MNETEKLFREHLKLIISNPLEWSKLLSPNVVVEFPYADSMGLPVAYKGLEAVVNYRKQLPREFEKFEVTKLEVFDHKDSNSLTAIFEGRIPSEGQEDSYAQKYICFFRTENGSIAHYIEYWNPTPMIQFMEAR